MNRRSVRRPVVVRVVLLLVFILASVASVGFVPVPAPVAGATDPCDDFHPVTNATRQWVPVVSETLKTAWGTVWAPQPDQFGALLNNNDNFLNHGPSHDWSSHLKLDSAYWALSNAGSTEQKSSHIIEVEWEAFLQPDWAKTVAGDRQWVMGRWVLDCMHSKKTEIHPPVATAVVRSEPAILPGFSSPLPAKEIRFWANPKGGYRTTSINGRTYSFEVPLPTRPSATAPLAFRAFRPVDSSLGTFDYVAPKITPLPNATSPTKLLVSFSTVGRTSSRPIAAQIVAGWRHTPSASKVRKLRVIFDKLTVKDDEDSVACGEWRMVVGASGHWYTIPQDKLSDVGSSPVPFVDCSDGTNITINKTINLDVHNTGLFSLLNIYATGFECDLTCGEAPPNFDNTDDPLSGLWLPLTSAQDFGIGRTIVARTPNYDLTFRVFNRTTAARNADVDKSRGAAQDGVRDGKKHGSGDEKKKGAGDHRKKGNGDGKKHGNGDHKKKGAGDRDAGIRGENDTPRRDDAGQAEDIWYIDAMPIRIPSEKFEGVQRMFSED